MAFVFRSERNLLKSSKDNNEKEFNSNELSPIKTQKDSNDRYNNLLESPSPCFKSTERNRTKKIDDSPGPGTYNISKGYYDKHRQFSSRQDNAIPPEYDYFNIPLMRMKEVVNNNPGPGYYNPYESKPIGGKYKYNNTGNNSSSNNISKSVINIFRRRINNDKDKIIDIDKNMDTLIAISSPKKRNNELSKDKDKDKDNNSNNSKMVDFEKLFENKSLKNIKNPILLYSSEVDNIKKKGKERLNSNFSKKSGLSLETEGTSVNSSKISYSQIRVKTSKLSQKLNNQLYSSKSHREKEKPLYKQIVCSTEQNPNVKNFLLPTVNRYDKSRIHKNSQNHERILLNKEQDNDLLSKNIRQFNELLNSEYFSDNPGPGYYDPIDLPNQKYFKPKIKSDNNEGKRIFSILDNNKMKALSPDPRESKADYNYIANGLKKDSKIRDLLFDVKKIAKLRIIREKEVIERNKIINFIKENYKDEQNYENNLKEIYENDPVDYRKIHEPKDLLFNFGSNDKRFKELKTSELGPGEYNSHLYKTIEEKNSNIKQEPNYQELYDKLENKTSLIERLTLNKHLLENPPVGYYKSDIISSIKYNMEYKNQVKPPIIHRSGFNPSVEKLTWKKAEEIKKKEKMLITLLGPGKYYKLLNKTFNNRNKTEDNINVKPPFGSSDLKETNKKPKVTLGPGEYDINSYYNWITRTFNILFV